MEKINVAKLLKDCPKGMELDCTMFDNVYFKCIREHAAYPIVCYTIDSKGNTEEITFSWYGKYALLDTAKCVIFPKGKTTWEGFVPPCKFKNEDILYITTNDGKYNLCMVDCIIGGILYTKTSCSCNGYFLCTCEEQVNIEELVVMRFATEEEKEKLFKAIEDNGYKWNPETKTLEKITRPNFKVGDWIIRNNKYTGIPVKVIEFNGYYSCELNGEVVNLTLNDVHNNFHLWTIQDAQDGDVLVDKDNNIGIFQKFEGIYWYSYIYLGCDGKLRGFSIGGSHKQTDVHPATKEQRNLLYQKIKENGYEWNFETKTLEKVIKPEFKVGDIIQDLDSYKVTITKVHIEEEYYEYESVIAKGIGSIRFLEQSTWELVPNKFDITTLKPFDKVLVRQNITGKWGIDFFGSYNEGYYHATGGCAYRYCIPYEGNEHLRDTRKDCDEYYKVWE